jgi:hypothetical protein
MSHNHPIPLDWVPVEDREEIANEFKRLITSESEFNQDKVRITCPIFICNSITPFCPVPFVFELIEMSFLYDGIKNVGIIIILKEENGKLIAVPRCTYTIPIDDFKQLTKNLIFIPFYIPDNCSYYPL